MREAMHHIRAKIYNALNGNITYNAQTIPVYNRVPTTINQNSYIWIYSLSTNEINQNADKFMLDTITRIEVNTRFSADAGGDLQANSIVNDCLSLLRTRSSGYFDLSSDNFNVYGVEVASINYTQEDQLDATYIKGIIELRVKVEQTS